MAGLKSLAKDTAIYGLSSIVGRFLNYLLVPIYAAAMSAASGGYGVVTEVYAWTALLMVILTYGMETTFFRFVNKETENSERVYSTVLFMVGSTSLIFATLCMLFLHPVAGMMGYGDHPWYIGMMALVIAMDAFQCIPFAYLRYKKRPIRFAALKLLFILLNITLNLVYYVVMKGSDVFYAFFFNLICTSVIMVLMVPYLKFNGGFDKPLAKRMLIYSYPILILGVAGILNQVADKIIFRHIYPDKVEAKTQLAIYGACSKIAMIMAMLTQVDGFVIIENIHVFGIFGMSERALEVSRQIIHINLLRCSAVDKHFIVVFIQNNSVDKIIFFGTLSLPVYFPYALTGLSVINKNVAVVCPVLHQQIFVAYIHHTPLSHKFITCLQWNVFHIHKILKEHFLL